MYRWTWLCPFSYWNSKSWFRVSSSPSSLLSFFLLRHGAALRDKLTIESYFMFWWTSSAAVNMEYGPANFGNMFHKFVGKPKFYLMFHLPGALIHFLPTRYNVVLMKYIRYCQLLVILRYYLFFVRTNHTFIEISCIAELCDGYTSIIPANFNKLYIMWKYKKIKLQIWREKKYRKIANEMGRRFPERRNRPRGLSW